MHDVNFYENLSEPEIEMKIKEAGFDPIKISNEKGYEYPSHHHSETKILAILNGTIKVIVEGELFFCNKYDRIIIPGNAVHSATVGDNGCDFFWAEKVI